MKNRSPHHRAQAGREKRPGGVIPRKRFGQHFLADRAYIDAIVRAIAPKPGDRLIEIGPGTGVLTAPLVALAGHITVIEIDRDLAPRLQALFGDALTLVQQDVLQVDFAALADGTGGGRLPGAEAPGDDRADTGTSAGKGEVDSGTSAGTRAAATSMPAARAAAASRAHKLRIVGNLPYNISSPLLLHLIAVADRVEDQHFMLQKEVVDRIVAAPGSDMGRLTVFLQNHYHVAKLFDVPPDAFDPPPKVDSSVVRMVPRAQPVTTATAPLQAALSAAYAQRRKMLRGTLGSWLAQQYPAFSLVQAAAADPRLMPLTDLSQRPEQIPAEAWYALADALAGQARD